MGRRTSCRIALCLVLTADAIASTQDAARTGRTDAGARQPPVQVAFRYRPDPASSLRPLPDGAIVRSGQEIKVELQARSAVHAYVLHRGSSGKWVLLFPNARLTSDTGAVNPLAPNKAYSIPGTDAALFLDDREGVEEFLVYATPEPDAALEAIAARLRDGEQLTINILDDTARTRPPSSGDKPASPARERTRADQPVVGEVSVTFRDIIVVPTATSATFDLPAGRAVARVRFQHRR
jgi:hypothetical protein